MKFIACGDSLFSSRNLIGKTDRKVTEYLKNADGCFTNAEFCTPKRNTPPAPGRGYMTSVRAYALDELAALNIRLISLVNNHSGDFGWQGIEDTIEAAEQRNLIYCGVGRNLKEARLPQFLDTGKGRVGIVAASSTRSEIFLAADEGAGCAARPGVNPLRWNRAYVLPEKEFRELRHIDEILGTRASASEGIKIETWPEPEEDTFPFGSMFEGHLTIERGEYAHVRTWAHQQDENAILTSIRDAAKRSDLTLFSLHTHEGINENWYSPQPPEFIEKICHDAIDSGADAVIGHGAHFMRGVEIYKGRPIFYNLGSLFMEFEAGESIITPEMYESYGYTADSRPSDLHGNRVKDRNGNFIGFASEKKFSWNCMAQLEKERGKLTWKLIPLDIHLDDDAPLKRGLPTIASSETALQITEYLNEISKRYGTRLVFDKNDFCIKPINMK